MPDQTQEQDWQDIADLLVDKPMVGAAVDELFNSATAYGIGAIVIDPEAVPMFSSVAVDAIHKMQQELLQIAEDEESA